MTLETYLAKLRLSRYIPSMRRVPEFLPPTIHVWTNPPKNGLGGAIAAGTHVNAKHPIVTPTLMNLMTYQSPALVHGLLMTEIL